MIGSTLGQISAADKLSVAQLQDAIQNGTVPAYIGVPMLREKVNQTKRAEMAASQPPQSPPIAQQVMQEAQAVTQPQIPMYQQQAMPQQGVANLPSNLPAQGMKEGGIVAFADGGLYDQYRAQTEEEEYLDTLGQMVAMANQMGLIGSSPDKFSVPYEMTTPNVEQFQPQESVVSTQQPSSTNVKQPSVVNTQQGGIGELIAGAAGRYNLPPELMQNIAGAESSGRADAANPRSSAKGVFQFIDSTWEGLGGKPGEQFDPEKNVEMGAKYLRQNTDMLRDRLGRNPSYSEVYAAHYFGPGVVNMLQNADPSDPIEVGLGMFNNDRGVKRILRANPNLQNKTVGEVLASLTKKAGEGVVEMAGGGIVALAPGGEVSGVFGGLEEYGFDPYGQPLEPESTGPTFRDLLIPESMKGSSYYQLGQNPSATPAPREAPKKASSQKTTQEAPKTSEIPTVDVTDTQTMQERAAAPSPTAVPEKAETLYDQFLKDYMDSKSDRERQKKMDAYMALATAGFAMAGGNSPNAVQNIAQGALAGMGQYAGAQKAMRAEEREDVKNLLTAQRYKELGEAARATTAMAEARLTQEERNRLTRSLLERQSDIQTALEKSTEYRIGTEAVRQQLLAEQLAQDPVFNNFYKDIYGLNYADALKQQASRSTPAIGGAGWGEVKVK